MLTNPSVIVEYLYDENKSQLMGAVEHLPCFDKLANSHFTNVFK